MSYRVVFMGTPDFAVPPLKALLDAPDFQVVGVVTQPDRPAGRGKNLQESPVKQAANGTRIPVFQPEKLRAPGSFEQLQSFQPDLIVVAAFGQILRSNVLELPQYGCINVHASLLPRWRGAAPIQAAVRAGDSHSGITIMKMDAGLDTGDMLLAQSISLETQETGQSLHDKLAQIGGSLLLTALRGYLSGAIMPQKQDENLSTYAPMLKKEDGLINWGQSALEIERQVRAYHPWPGTFTLWQGEPLKILPDLGSTLPVILPGKAEPGLVVHCEGMIGIGTSEGIYLPRKVQLAGRPAVEVSAFVNGRPGFVGAVLG